jgi:hypothetical protein
MSEQWIEKNGVKRPVYDNPGDFPATCMLDYQSPEERIVWIKATDTSFYSGDCGLELHGWGMAKVALPSKASAEAFLRCNVIRKALADVLRDVRGTDVEAVVLYSEHGEIVEEWPIA